MINKEYEVGHTQHNPTPLSNSTSRPYRKKQNYSALWDTVKGPPPKPEGETPFFSLQCYYSGHFGFDPLYPPHPPPRREVTNESGHAIECVTEMDLKK